MPELPEVETTVQGIKTPLIGQTIQRVEVRQSKLRYPVNENINTLCQNKIISHIHRRAKYILIGLDQAPNLELNTSSPSSAFQAPSPHARREGKNEICLIGGHLLIHLGMSGHLRMINQDIQPEKHDHLDLVLNNGMMLRYCDPRRFGLFIYIEENPYQHSLLQHLGPEPLSPEFNAEYLARKTKGRLTPIKSLIMNNDVVVGVGNIYATESLFLAKIHPSTQAKNLNNSDCERLCLHIKQILQQAIQAGGTTLRDFYSSEGKPGYFSMALQVYGRQNQPCFTCKSLISSVIVAGRNSAFCAQCQG